MLFAFLLTAFAHAQSSAPAGFGMDDVVSTDSKKTDTFLFSVPACDRIKALARDERALEDQATDKLVVVVKNTSSRMCLYKGVALLGFLEGTYSTSIRNPDGTGFFIAPGSHLSITIKPKVPNLPRGAVELQIPPSKGLIILRGVAPEDVPVKTAE